MFGLNPSDPILNNIQKITDTGRGQELEQAMNDNKIKNELWTWLGTPRGDWSLGQRSRTHMNYLWLIVAQFLFLYLAHRTISSNSSIRK